METPKSNVKSRSTDVPPDAADDDREPTKAEIMEDIRQGLRDLKAGYEGQDALKSLAELRREIYGDADAG
jgi:hypothetical protein